MLRDITELNFEDFSEAEANPVASYGECSSSTCWILMGAVEVSAVHLRRELCRIGETISNMHKKG